MKKTFTVLRFNEPDAQGDVFLPGCVSYKKILITRDFNHEAPISIVQEVTLPETELKVTAEIPFGLEFLTPAIGFEIKSSVTKDNIRTITEMNLCYIGLCEAPNIDTGIQPINKQ